MLERRVGRSGRGLVNEGCYPMARLADARRRATGASLARLGTKRDPCWSRIHHLSSRIALRLARLLFMSRWYMCATRGSASLPKKPPIASVDPS